MSNLIDVRDYMFADQAWAASNHLYDPVLKLPIYNYPNLQSKKLWQIKSDNGYPWDGNSWDNNYIYQLLTEGPNGWADVNSYKSFVTPLKWCPLFINPGDSVEILTTDSSYKTFPGGVITPSLGGPIIISAELVKGIDFGGSLEIQDALVQRYKWGNNYLSMEVNCYVQGYGLVRWQLYNRDVNGLYTNLIKTVNYNTFMDGGVPALQLPVGVTP